MKARISEQNILFGFLGIAFLLGPLASVGWGETSAEVVAKLQKISPDQRQAFLEKGAKKEGTFILYGTTAVDHGNKILAGFRHRYPFLETKYYRAGTTALLRKILTEARSGRYEPDVMNIAPGAAYELRRVGLVEKYRSPNRSALMQGMADKDGYYTAWQHIVVVIAYNTELVEKKDVPKSYEDLLRPRWKGKIHLDTQDADWFHTLLEYWGEEKGLDYMKKLSTQDPQIRTGHTLGAQLLAAGEFHISPLLYGYRVSQMMAQGAPLDIVFIDPVISKPRGLTLAKHASHPYTAILYLDWMLSEEAQKLVGDKLGRSPTRRGITSKYERLDYPKFVTVDSDTLGPVFGKRLKQYAEIFKFR